MCLLWFMNQAVRNERLAVRQKLAEAYRANLSLIQNQLEANWRQTAGALDAEAERLRSARALCEASPRRPGRCRDLFRPDRERRLSEPSAGLFARSARHRLDGGHAPGVRATQRKQPPPSPAWPGQATNADEAARALQAQARCLVKAGRTNEAVAVLTGPLEEERYQHATDAQGRLLVPNAELMALELLQGSAPGRAHVTRERLKQRVLDYEDRTLSAPQRRFLMRELQQLCPDPAVAQMLAAEDLAARWLEAGSAHAGRIGLSPDSFAGCVAIRLQPRASGDIAPD